MSVVNIYVVCLVLLVTDNTCAEVIVRVDVIFYNDNEHTKLY